MKGNFVFRFSFFVLILLLAACQPYQFKGTEYPEGIQAEDFTLTTTDGRPFRLSDQSDQIVLMFFGYTSCPDVCPTTLAQAKRVLDGLDDDAANVRFLFITVDPERDTPQHLGQYVSNFHPDIIGLTGTAEELQTVLSAYGIYAAKVPLENSAAGYSMDHTARVFLVDQDGRLRLSYAFGTPDTEILQDVQHLLR